MRRLGRRRLATAAGLVAAATLLAVVLVGVARGIALGAYVLVLVAIAVASLSSRLRAAWPATTAFERLFPARVEPTWRVGQLEGLVGRLSGGEPSAFVLHQRVRPLVRDIAAARLARGHGVDLEGMPERAQALVGPRTWELIRPDREAPHDRHARPWSSPELNELVDELERI
jgi:hypothetical protein